MSGRDRNGGSGGLDFLIFQDQQMRLSLFSIAAKTQFYNVNRLYEEAAQSYFFFAALISYITLKLPHAAFLETVSTNEDLLLPIARSSKSQVIVLLYILLNDTGQGKRGMNVFKLIKTFAAIDSKFASLEKPLRDLRPITRKLCLLRNNQTAHFCATDEWRKGFGNGVTIPEMRKVFSSLYSALYSFGGGIGYPARSTTHPPGHQERFQR